MSIKLTFQHEHSSLTYNPESKKKLNRFFIGEELSYMVLKVLYFMPLLFLVFFLAVGKVINQIIFSIIKDVCTKLKLKRKEFYFEYTHKMIFVSKNEFFSKLGCEMLANVYFFLAKRLKTRCKTRT